MCFSIRHSVLAGASVLPFQSGQLVYSWILTFSRCRNENEQRNGEHLQTVSGAACEDYPFSFRRHDTTTSSSEKCVAIEGSIMKKRPTGHPSDVVDDIKPGNQVPGVSRARAFRAGGAQAQ